MARLRIYLDWTQEQVASLIEEKRKALGIEGIDVAVTQASEAKGISETAPRRDTTEEPVRSQAPPMNESVGDLKDGGRSYHSYFMRLSAEVRYQIWQHCIPTDPTAQFFEIVEGQRSPLTLHNWSPQFRTAASRTFPSGYISGTCPYACAEDSHLTPSGMAHFRHSTALGSTGRF